MGSGGGGGGISLGLKKGSELQPAVMRTAQRASTVALEGVANDCRIRAIEICPYGPHNRSEKIGSSAAGL